MRAAGIAAAALLTLALAVRSAPARGLAPQTPAAAPQAPAPAASPDAPRVRLVATGGTISNRDGGRLTAEELVKLMPAVGRYARPEYEQFSNLASSALT